MSPPRFFRRLVSCVLVAGFVTISPIGSLTTRAAPASSVIIGEVAWAGSSLSTADEWIELWNVSDAPISLAGWSLRGAGESGRAIIFPSGAKISPRGAYLISNDASSDAKSAIAASIAIDVVTTTVSLSNSALKIELLDASGAVIDVAGSGGAPPAGASLPTKITMLRDGDAWINATSSQNLKSGVADLGTPGFCDGCATEAIAVGATPASSDMTNVTNIIDATTTDVTLSSMDVIVDPATSVASTTSPFAEREATSTDVASDSTASSTSVTTMAIAHDPPPVTVASAAMVTPPASAITSDEKPKPNYGMLRLNEVAPHPASGNEWIEIVTLDAGQKINLKGCEIHDAAGRILTLGSREIDPAASRYEVVKLASTRLNDGGDTVALYAPDGRLLDVMRYGATSKGASWVRFPDLSGDWQMTDSTTPAAANQLVPATAAATSAPQITASVATLPTASSGSTPSTVSPTSSDDIVDLPTSTRELAALVSDETRDALAQQRMDERNAEEQLRLEALDAQDAARAAQENTMRATRRVALAATYTSITFDMLTNDELGGMRVRLAGRVGSVPGLLSKHTFVLQSPDGRGLLVTASSRQKLPNFGSDVAVVGSLRIDDRGIASLRELTHDAWSRIPTTTESVAPRIVDLLAPSAEDAWSLVHVTGTVTQANGASVHLDLGDTNTTIVVKPVLKYRVKRLVVGDVIAVTGLLDTSVDEPRVFPRMADEIALVSHAPPKTAVNGTGGISPTLPNWAPLGAAAGAVAATEGAKQWHRRRKMKKLEKLAA